MALSNNQKIMIVGIFIAAIVAIWTTTYMYSPDLVHTSYNPPDVISSKPENALSFDLTNYGEKTGSYKLYLNSNEILFSSLKSYDLDDYQEMPAFKCCQILHFFDTLLTKFVTPILPLIFISHNYKK